MTHKNYQQLVADSFGPSKSRDETCKGNLVMGQNLDECLWIFPPNCLKGWVHATVVSVIYVFWTCRILCDHNSSLKPWMGSFIPFVFLPQMDTKISCVYVHIDISLCIHVDKLQRPHCNIPGSDG